MCRRRFLGLLASAIVLLAQLHVWEAEACSMCGASCRCASRAAENSCCVRAVGCGGAASGDAIAGSGAPLRAILASAVVVAPRLTFDRAYPAPDVSSPQPVRDPLDRPPRVSC